MLDIVQEKSAVRRSQQDPPLTAGSVARLAGCSRVTVWRAIERGELEAFRLGPRGTYRVPVDAVERWLNPTEAEMEQS